MNPKQLWTLSRTTFQEFQQDNATRLAAALSYYAAVSMAPLIVIVLLVAGLLFGQQAAQGELVSQVEGMLGEQGAQFITTIIENADQPTIGSIAGILSLLALLWGSTNLFAQLQNTLNTIWDVKPAPDVGWMYKVRKRSVSFLLVLGIGLLLLASLIVGTVLSALAGTLSGLLPGFTYLWQVFEFIVSVIVATVLFAALFKVLPDAKIAWSDVWFGAAVTGFLFSLGKLALNIYLGNAGLSSTYGAAGSVIVFLIWVYYTAIIIFLGAEFTQVYANRYGSGVHPDEHTVFTDRRVTTSSD